MTPENPPRRVFAHEAVEGIPGNQNRAAHQ
jgi:hypothetical protein